MNRSTDRILTTHAGSLPRPAELLEAISERERGRTVDEQTHAAQVRDAVRQVVRKQIELGIDVIDDGEYSKPSFVTYTNERLGGFEIDKEAPQRSPWAGSREALSFPEFYALGHVGSRQHRPERTADNVGGGQHQQRLNRESAFLGAGCGV